MTNRDSTIPTPTTETQTASPKNSLINKPAKPYLAGIALLIAIIALACSIFTIMISSSMKDSGMHKIQAMQTEVKNVKQQQTNFDKKLKFRINAFKRSQAKLNENYERLHKNLEAALQQHFYQTNDWLLLKARYYLELAQINGYWSDGTSTTLALLQQADNLLAELNDQKLFAVRQAIANEISYIKAFPKIDTAGVLSRLDAAQSLIITLPIKAVNTTPENQNKDMNVEQDSAWREAFRDSINRIKKLVIIRHHSEDIEPLLSIEQTAMLRENIRLNLQEAQWAVLQNNDAVYQLTLKQAIDNITRTFQTKADNTQTLLRQLQDLKDIRLVQQKPNIEQSLRSLNQVIDAQKIPNKASIKEGEATS